ncbi:hypothetical protein H7171_04000 [Candidatus Saccharibacteria bacterium]|nr:hypothetical protein [Candidatus Saccharibacteria bacterium]
MQPQNPNQFDFIINPQQPQRRSVKGFGGGMVKRIVVVGGGLVLLLIIFVVVKGLLTPTTNLPSIANLVARQQELIFITSQQNNTRDLSIETQSAVITTNLALQSEQKALLSYLSSQGFKVGPKDIGAYSTVSTTAKLKQAKEVSTYEPTLKEILQSRLDAYQTALAQTYDKTTGTIGRELLKNTYASSILLNKQLAKR